MKKGISGLIDKEVMADKIKQLTKISGILILILALTFVINGCANEINNLNAKTVNCIAGNSTVYVSATCSLCTEQKETFGDLFKNLKAVDCAEEAQTCLEAGISQVPTWIISGEKMVGLKSIEELKELTGC